MLTRLPAHLDQLIRAELWPDEELIWWGQPQARRSLVSSIIPALLGGLILAPVLPFFLFSLFGVVILFVQLLTGEPLGEVLANGVPTVLFLLLTLPFAGTGLFLLSLPWWSYRSTKRTAYALTNQRAIIRASRFRRDEMRSYPLQALRKSKVVRRDHRGGIGDLVFVEAEYNKDEVRKTVTMRHEEGFHAIRAVKDVEVLIQELRRALD